LFLNFDCPDFEKHRTDQQFKDDTKPLDCLPKKFE